MINFSNLRSKWTFRFKIFFFHELLSFCSLISIQVQSLEKNWLHLFISIRTLFNCISIFTQIFGFWIDLWLKCVFSFYLFLRFQVFLLGFIRILFNFGFISNHASAAFKNFWLFSRQCIKWLWLLSFMTLASSNQE